MRLLLDEDLPRSLLLLLQQAGVEAHRVVDAGLRGRPDDEVFAAAIARGLTLVTADLGFGHRALLSPHHGVVIARFPHSMPAAALARRVADVLLNLTDDEIRGAIVTIEPGRVRLRKHA